MKFLMLGLEDKEVEFQLFIINISETTLIDEVDLFGDICLRAYLKDGGMQHFNRVRVSQGRLVEVNSIIDFYSILEEL